LQGSSHPLVRVLVLGDIVGDPGVNLLQKHLPALRKKLNIDVVVANAENASGGSGLTPGAFKKIKNSGVDLVTLGDHVYKKQEITSVLESDNTICRPANYPQGAPGKLFAEHDLPGGLKVYAICLMGRTFMRPVDCPFRAIDSVLDALPQGRKIIVVDVHAEATADKYLLGNYLAGRVGAVLGTHTHIPTADEHIMEGQTAFLCDLGMTGPYKSILGRSVEPVMEATLRFVHRSFEVANEDPRLSGALIEISSGTGNAVSIRRVHLREREIESLQAF
jgi:metallophosphoesterase (TIGR00282 family)